VAVILAEGPLHARRRIGSVRGCFVNGLPSGFRQHSIESLIDMPSLSFFFFRQECLLLHNALFDVVNALPQWEMFGAYSVLVEPAILVNDCSSQPGRQIGKRVAAGE